VYKKNVGFFLAFLLLKICEMVVLRAVVSVTVTLPLDTYNIYLIAVIS